MESSIGDTGGYPGDEGYVYAQDLKADDIIVIPHSTAIFGESSTGTGSGPDAKGQLGGAGGYRLTDREDVFGVDEGDYQSSGSNDMDTKVDDS